MMAAATTKTFVLLAGREFDETVSRINTYFDNDDIAGAQAELAYQIKWSDTARGMCNIHAILAEYAAAAVEALNVIGAMLVPCTDCGDPIPWNAGDAEFEGEKRIPVATCAECGDGRDFHHATGKYYDAFA